MSTPVFSLKNITFSYPGTDRTVLDDTTFALKQGERIGLIGPNGSGKTTFFNIVMGLLKPTSGSVFFDEQEMKTEKDFFKLRTGIGYLFQDADDQLFSPTVLEDVAFGPLNLGLSPEEAKQRACETLNLVGLSDFEKRLTHRLSGGEKKLVSLAAVLAMKPKALLLDEPTNGLAPETRSRIIDVLNTLRLPNITISHDWEFLAETTESFATIKNRKITCDIHVHVHHHAHAHPAGDVGHVHE